MQLSEEYIYDLKMENSTTNNDIKAHYHRDSIYESIVDKLTEIGISPDQVTREDLSKADEFHVRGAQVSKELANKVQLKNASILDVGCGIGGPCRMLADEFGCQVTGIDLSDEFIRTAQKLTELVGLESKVNFVQGDATSLPFEDASFDIVWTQHVQMNIPDKHKFYSEIIRVLKPNGRFIYYDIFKKGESITYPMPWASTKDISYLFTIREKESIFKNLNLCVDYTNDETSAGIEFFENLFQKISKGEGPALGLNILMGDSTKIKLGNLLDALKKGGLELESGICSKTS